MNLYRYTLRTGWRKFGGQSFMAWFEENMGDFDGMFALTGWALLLHPAGHALLPMACFDFIAES